MSAVYIVVRISVYWGSPSGASLFYGVIGDMLERTLQENPLYIEYEPLLAQLGLTIVEIAQANRREGVNVVIIILAREGETTVDQCADVYRLVFPRMQLALGERDLSLEVSTPGLERSFKDLYEFTLFAGRRVRVYDSGRSAWVSGIIEAAQEESVVLSEVFVEEKNEKTERMNIAYSAIQKAKLDYRWEDERHGN